MLIQIVAAMRQIISGILAVPGDLMRWLTGADGTPLPSGNDNFADEVDAQAAELRHRLAEAPRAPGIAATTLGGLVHAYASGDNTARDAFDVGAVPDHVAAALMTLAPEQLTKLSTASPEACGKWALGQRSGIVGLPTVKRWVPTVTIGTKSAEDQASALVPEGEAPFGMHPRWAA